MKLPRNLDSNILIKKLEILGYSITRQTGSHIRVSTKVNGENHETIPFQEPLKAGTLNVILKHLSVHHHLTREQLFEKLQLF